MPSTTHDGLLQPFEHQPGLAADLLTDTFGLKLPAWQHARLTSADLTQVTPTEFRADLTIALYHADEPVLGVVLEVQLRKDLQTEYSWPVYLSTLRARLRCPTVLLVVCPRPATAAWAANPIELGPDSVTTPQVLGPHQIPVVTDPAQARNHPELVVLSALTHGRNHPQRHEVLDAFLAGLATLEPVDQERAEIYHDVVSAVLPKAARLYLEKLMSTGTYQFKSEWALRHINRGKTEGRIEGRAEDVLTVLTTRGIAVSEKARQRISECKSLDKLDAWLRRAATAESIKDVLGK